MALCLDMLLAQSIGDQTEIIVVDNPSTDDMTSLQRHYPMVRWLYEPTPGSYAARNTGIAAVRRRILAFTDSDCLPPADWLEHGIAPLRYIQLRWRAVNLVTSRLTGLSAAELLTWPPGSHGITLSNKCISQ
jgi:glycosyltransferase involved in cell wall biosynthesis